MTQNQYRLNEVARTLGVEYHWLSYRIATGKTPVRKKIAYSSRDVVLLRAWVGEQNQVEAAIQETTISESQGQ